MNRPADERKIRRKVKEMNELKEGLTNRACTKKIIVGSVEIGGGTSVKIQSMTTTKTSDVAATVRQIEALKEAGCEIVRVAVADEDDAAAVKAVKEKISLPARGGHPFFSETRRRRNRKRCGQGAHQPPATSEGKRK